MINWHDIDTVLLDMDGTLLDLHFDNYFWQHHLPKRFAAIHQQPQEQINATLRHLFERERGTLNWYCVNYWSRELNLDIAELKKEVAHLIAVRPHVEEFLRRLRQSGRRVILVTNAHQLSMELKFAHTNLHQWMDEIVCSHDFGEPKESLLFWQRLQKKHPFNPARTLFVDDSINILHTAQAFGIRYLLTLLQPDSQIPLRDINEFPAIHHFDEIMGDIKQLSL